MDEYGAAADVARPALRARGCLPLDGAAPAPGSGAGRRAGRRTAWFGVAAAVAAVIGLAGCSGTPADRGPTASGGAPSSSVAANPEDAPNVGATPPPFDPSVYAHGDFVGALQIDYLGDRSSASAQAADQAYQGFFNGGYDGPFPGKSTVLRLTAMVDPRDGDRLLRLGAVVDTITAPNELVIGLHNVLTIEGSVELNGQVHDQSVAGASGVMEVGDRMTLWTPNANDPGMVNRYVYEVVNLEGGDAAYSVVDADENIDTVVYQESPSEDFFQLTTYICWPPNQLAQRLVTRLELVESSIEQGSVTPHDPA